MVRLLILAFVFGRPLLQALASHARQHRCSLLRDIAYAT